ncbi:hypothetical protein VINE108274_08945 [Vibrio neptunius]
MIYYDEVSKMTNRHNCGLSQYYDSCYNEKVKE